MIIAIVLISAVLLGASFCTITKAGKKDGISKYGQDEE